ncbi:MAG TPA: YcxB family protein [Pyrinomonadaceae bacterium]|nr:YcxB family protein [Pyrinomonadaceae bacterium]
MHVQFAFTQEDMLDATRRFMARSKVVAASRRKGLILTAAFTGLLLFGLFYWYGHPLAGGPVGLIGAAVSALLYPSSHRKAVDKQLRKYHHELFGDAKSFVCEVELTTAGVLVKQMDRQVLYEWPSITEILETNDSVDIFTKDGAGVVVRNRAFTTPDDKSEFLRLARASCQTVTQ